MGTYMIFTSFCTDGNTLWLLERNRSSLCRASLSTGEIIEEYIVSRERMFEYTDIVSWKNYVIMVPGYADEVIIVDKLTREIRSLVIPVRSYEIGETGLKFFRGIVHNDSVYFFGFSYDCILQLNLLTNKFTTIEIGIGNLASLSKEDGCFHFNCWQQGSTVFFPMVNIDGILEFDLGTHDAKVHFFGGKQRGFFSIERFGDVFYLIPRNNDVDMIQRWNPNTGENDYFDFPIVHRLKNHCFFITYVTQNSMVLLINGSDKKLIYDFANNDMFLAAAEEDNHCFSKKEFNGGILLLRKHSIAYRNDKESIYWERHFYLNSTFQKRINVRNVMRLVEKRGCYLGESTLGLRDYIHYIVCEKG